MINHYEVHVIFQDAEHQLQEKILFHFLHYFFFNEIFIKLRSVFDPLKNYLLEAFATFPIHISDLHPSIQYMAIFYFYHNLSRICY